MKELTKKENQEYISFIACEGPASRKRDLSQFRTCQEAARTGFLMGECPYGCIGLGDCVTVCFRGALYIEKDGHVRIHKDICNGCGDCAQENVCPQNLISLIPKDSSTTIPCSSKDRIESRIREVCDYGCISCGECERICPTGAITIQDHHAVIDQELCVGCMACSSVCTKKIIQDSFHDIRQYKSDIAYVKCSHSTNYEIAKTIKARTCSDAMIMTAHNDRICPAGCFGLGDCLKKCRYNAIDISSGIVHINPDLCSGCGDCKNACPQTLIDIQPYKSFKYIACNLSAPQIDISSICPKGCERCGACFNNCPCDAVYALDGRFNINPLICADCEICRHVCPVDIIREMKVPFNINAFRKAMKTQKEGRYDQKYL